VSTGSPAEEPLVLVAIPCLDEAEAIGECLQRVRAQTWANLEVVVADGGSTDGTTQVVSRLAAGDHRIRLVDNPRRLQSAGLNEALAASPDASFVVRLDARSFVGPTYVARCVELLRSTASAVVGGRMVPRATAGWLARGIALANESKWGAGPARFHRAGTAGPAETVYLGAFDRSWIDRAGGWAEDVGVNEDYELNHRIRELGGQVWLDPLLEVGYQPRTTVRSLAKQYFRYGRSKATVMRRHPSSIKLRQVAPSLLVPLAVGVWVPGWPSAAARLGLGVYLLALALLVLRSPTRATDRVAGGVAAIVMHWSWSAGAWFGAVRPFERAS
jgi:glycosyltransferase involved in cell wall biosynthesis